MLVVPAEPISAPNVCELGADTQNECVGTGQLDQILTRPPGNSSGEAPKRSSVPSPSTSPAAQLDPSLAPALLPWNSRIVLPSRVERTRSVPELAPFAASSGMPTMTSGLPSWSMSPGAAREDAKAA